MKSLPLPLRVAAGLAATALEQARDLPSRLAGLPVTVASQALQVSMRVQQTVTELAIKGDEALAALRPDEESPEWATFDEDIDQEPPGADRRPAFDRVTDDDIDELDDLADVDDLADFDDEPAEADLPENGGGETTTRPGAATTPTTAPSDSDSDSDSDKAAAETDDDAAIAAELAEDAAADAPTEDPWEQERQAIAHTPAAVPNYDDLTLPQLRARLRAFSLAELDELLTYERAGENRPSFVGMLTRRIATVRDQT
ncbi:lipid droplet-associated protein [Actinokineospora iranica]|uniref:Lipid droplet-associated protein n=1 Tax=Actinokineospora iranica TaxID=1271860 RepID=A0A1G6RBD0_9PSEU|nr:lipid droplet-associated protein [Actinokineospora iranica]SDD01357.1 hypothetical protein SAMN05216174_106234 [Actinokineospora iranica]